MHWVLIALIYMQATPADPPQLVWQTQWAFATEAECQDSRRVTSVAERDDNEYQTLSPCMPIGLQTLKTTQN
jgi:hypothetical protein